MRTVSIERSGFTLVEIAVSTLLLSIVLLVVITSWLYLLYGQKLNAVQNELDIDVRTAMEWLRYLFALLPWTRFSSIRRGRGPMWR